MNIFPVVEKKDSYMA